VTSTVLGQMACRHPQPPSTACSASNRPPKSNNGRISSIRPYP